MSDAKSDAPPAVPRSDVSSDTTHRMDRNRSRHLTCQQHPAESEQQHREADDPAEHRHIAGERQHQQHEEQREQPLHRRWRTSGTGCSKGTVTEILRAHDIGDDEHRAIEQQHDQRERDPDQRYDQRHRQRRDADQRHEAERETAPRSRTERRRCPLREVGEREREQCPDDDQAEQRDPADALGRIRTAPGWHVADIRHVLAHHSTADHDIRRQGHRLDGPVGQRATDARPRHHHQPARVDAHVTGHVTVERDLAAGNAQVSTIVALRRHRAARDGDPALEL